MTSKLKLLSASSGFGLMLAFASPAYAQNTDANTLITNNVTVNYQVGGVGQTAINAQDTFRVDRKIQFTVSEKTAFGTTSVTSGQVDAITAFTIVNDSNDTLDFSLAATNTTGVSIGGGRGTDSIDVTAGTFEYYLDVNGDGLANDAGGWVSTLTLDNVPKNQTRHVLVRSDIPVAANGSVAVIQLAATALESAGGALTGVVGDGTTNTAAYQTIYAEDLTPIQGNATRDGVSWAWDDYTVSAPILSVAKTSRVVSDGVSGSNPKAIPGAVVEYCISVANAAGGATADNISISDLVPTNTTYVAGSIFVDATVTTPGATQSCSGGTSVTDAVDANAGEFGTPANTVVGRLSSIAATTARALIFRVTLN
jgi:uncharacterized repeat protein (TIGR01451 family)